MTTYNIYPQISWPFAMQLAEGFRRRDPVEICHEIDNEGINLNKTIYSAVGGNKVGDTELSEFRAELCKLAGELGFPEKAATREMSRRFDVLASALLHRRMGISANQASLPGVWQAMSCLVAPDLVVWRFSGSGDAGTPLARFRGGVRNAFERLWWRGEILGQAEGLEAYELVARLNEDELVQIMERPSVRANRRLARAVASVFLEHIPELALPRELLMRDVQKRIYRLLPFTAFEVLDDQVIRDRVAGIFSESIVALQSERAGGKANILT